MLGIGLMLIAYLTFSFVDTTVKWLAIVGLPALQLAFMRYFAHFAISLVIIGKDATWSAGQCVMTIIVSAMRPDFSI